MGTLTLPLHRAIKPLHAPQMDMGMGFGRPGFGPGFGGGGLMFDFFELQIIRTRWAPAQVAGPVCLPEQTVTIGCCD